MHAQKNRNGVPCSNADYCASGGQSGSMGDSFWQAWRSLVCVARARHHACVPWSRVQMRCASISLNNAYPIPYSDRFARL